MTEREKGWHTIKTNISPSEYAEIRKVAIDKRVNVGDLTGNQLRKLIPTEKRATL